MDILKELFLLQDYKYRDFHSKLMPNIDKERIIGVRIPEIRKLAKRLYKEINVEDFFNSLPHYYYEENNLHAFLIENIKDYNLCLNELEKFLPYIDNWATCDLLSVKLLLKNKDLFLSYIKKWLNSNQTYVIRFGVNMLMKYFLDDDFKDEYLFYVSEINNNDYYVKMGISWFFATSLAKQYDKTIIYLVENKLDIWLHNKIVQKVIESNRISDEKKMFLKSLKR